MYEFGHATIGIPTLGQLQTAVKALGYDVFDCSDHAKKAGVADWMDPDALRYAREFVPFIEEVAPKGKLSLGPKVWFKCLNYSSGTRHGACGAMCFTWGDKSHSLTLKHNDPNYDHEWIGWASAILQAPFSVRGKLFNCAILPR